MSVKGSPLQQRLITRSAFKTPTSHDAIDMFLCKNAVICRTNQAFIYPYMQENILKLVQYEEYACGRVLCPFRAEFCQALMQEILSKYVAEAGLSPHICLLMGHPVNPYYDKKKKKRNVVFFMERAPMGCVQDFVTQLMQTTPPSRWLDDYVLLIMFQVAYTLEAIYSVMPNFRHNDLKPTNVFVVQDTCPQKGTHTQYTVRGAHAAPMTFAVPNDLGVTSLLGDFDFSCCAGIVDNYKVIEYWAMYPHNNINWKRNHATDLAYFVKTLYRLVKHRLSPALRMDIEHVYGKEYLEKFTQFPAPGITKQEQINHMRGFPEDDAHLPTVRDVLCNSRLFATYKMVPTTALGERYTTAVTPVSDIKWPSWALDAAQSYRREVPLVGGIPRSVSFDVFTNKMPLHMSAIQEGMGNVYVDYTNDAESAPIYAQLFREGHVAVPIERSHDVVQHTQTNLRALLVTGDVTEAFAVCAMIDAVYSLGVYTMTTHNPDPEQWSQLLDRRYSTEQILQLMLQYTWMQTT